MKVARTDPTTPSTGVQGDQERAFSERIVEIRRPLF
jgi:hypothetical protein